MPLPMVDGYMHEGSYDAAFDGPASAANDISSTSLGGSQFDIFEWHPAYQSCQKYFLDHAQHDSSVQVVAALVNIRLPFQWQPPMTSYGTSLPRNSTSSTLFPSYSRQSGPPPQQRTNGPANWVSLVPYIRRLIITGFDKEAVLHGFFGNDFRKGVGPVQECERRNYLFAAKAGGWAQVKQQYDMDPEQSVPYLQPPQNIQLAEIESAEKLWSQWLAMEDWMVGPRAPTYGQGREQGER